MRRSNAAAIAAMVLMVAALTTDAAPEEAKSDFSDAIIAFDRYACPPGWIEFGGPTKRLRARPSAKRAAKAGNGASVVGPQQPAPPQTAAGTAYPPPAPTPAPDAYAGPQQARFGIIFCRKL